MVLPTYLKSCWQAEAGGQRREIEMILAPLRKPGFSVSLLVSLEGSPVLGLHEEKERE